MLKEIRVLAYVEKQRALNNEQGPEKFAINLTKADGLPKLLSYKLSLDGGEILMLDAGQSMDQWYEKGFSRQVRMQFAC